ncbi:MAG: cell division protein ZapA [Pseudomonadota bacterium]
MADVTVEIAGRRHVLGCEDGEEEHLRALAREIDAEAVALAARMASPEEARLMLMVALVMADRAVEARTGAEEAAALREEVAGLRAELAPLQAERAVMADALNAVPEREAAMNARLTALAERIEALTQALASA